LLGREHHPSNWCSSNLEQSGLVTSLAVLDGSQKDEGARRSLLLYVTRNAQLVTRNTYRWLRRH
jgi:hypothetical protein